jgi:hypothetical protein
MFKINQQVGSANAGLLASSAIFVGLLVYASYFAFDSNSKDLVSGTEKSVLSNNNPSTAIVAPLSRGIFESETIAVKPADVKTRSEFPVTESFVDTTSESSVTEVNTANVAINDSTPLNNPVDAQSFSANKIDEVTSISQPVKQVSVRDKATEAASAQTLPGTEYQSMIQPVYSPYLDNEAVYLAGQDRVIGSLHHQQLLYGHNKGRGYGRGQADMNGDGEFDFTMNFKGRARMDANSDWNSDFNGDVSGYNRAYYDQGSNVHPTLRTYYQRY